MVYLWGTPGKGEVREQSPFSFLYFQIVLILYSECALLL